MYDIAIVGGGPGGMHAAYRLAQSGPSIEYSTPEVEAIVIDRKAFDRALCERAERSGVSVQIGERITDVQITDAGTTLITATDRLISARACVLACGANYALQKRLGLGMPAMHLQSAQIEVPALEPGDVEVHFGNDVAPKGFAWIVPVSRGNRTFARVGLMCERDAREHFDRFLSRVGPRWKTGSMDCLDGGLSPR